MLYLEDYLEMIEHLPQELGDQFTVIRETDLSVQNRVDSVEKRQKQFFVKCAQDKKWKQSDREEEFNRIRKEYHKVIEEAGEKVNLAEDAYSLVDKYMRKLDQELLKFKLELEADNRGITEILEKRSLEMDQQQQPSSQATHKENRLPKKSRKSHAAGASGLHLPGTSSGGGSGYKKGDSAGMLAGGSLSFDGASMQPSQQSSAIQAALASYPLQHMGAGGNAIAQAASQAIAATQQLTGRRTSSLKASLEAINLGLQTHDFSIGGELATAAQSALAASSLTGAIGGAGGIDPTGMATPPGSASAVAGPSSTKRKKMSKSAAAAAAAAAMNPVLDVGGSFDEVMGDPGSAADDLLRAGDPGAGAGADQDWYADPSEPRYCICNQVSYGDMVACDNEDCLYEWFHYPCVGISAPPKGKWYCPNCTVNMARRKGRK